MQINLNRGHYSEGMRFDLLFVLLVMLSSLVLHCAGQPASTANGIDGDLLAKASAGDPQKQYEIGRLYELGQGVDKDLKRAADWFSKAAEQGNADAEVQLGALYDRNVFYDNQNSVAHDDRVAITWYRKAIAQGNVLAMRYLANVYQAHAYDGGENPNTLPYLRQTLEWMSKAAAGGDAEAQDRMAVWYSGFGTNKAVAPDAKLCMEWTQRAASQGNQSSELRLGKFFETGVPGVMSSDRDQAAVWFGKALDQDKQPNEFVRGSPVVELQSLANSGNGKAINIFALSFVKRGNTAEALSWFRKGAAQSNAESQYYLSLCYLKGVGVDLDANQGAVLLRKSAQQGYLLAEVTLGSLYIVGQGVTQDYAQAAEWLQKAANGGEVNAQNTLGNLYYLGLGVKKDSALAGEFYAKAAKQGNEAAKGHLRVLAAEAGDKEANSELLSLASDKGDSIAETYLGTIYYEGRGVPKDHAKAVEWFSRAAVHTINGTAQTNMIAQYYITKLSTEENSPKIQSILGDMYFKGQGEKQDYTQAALWYRKAADQSYAEAELNLARMYDQGQGVPLDAAQGNELFRRAAEHGNPDAEYGLGLKCFTGQGVAQDYPQAAIWFRKAAEHGSALGEYSLAAMYYQGNAVKQDYAQAAVWYRKAAEQDNANSQYFLGSLYAQGRGVQQDYQEAYFWIYLSLDGNRLPAALLSTARSTRDSVTSRLPNGAASQVETRAANWLSHHKAVEHTP
jgi:TPR repeat protein